MKRQESILGLSVGTYTMGIALLKDGELREYCVRNFRGAWSDKKLDYILATIQHLFDSYGVQRIALKMLHPARSSAGLNRLAEQIKTRAETCNIRFFPYTLEELEHYYSRAKRIKKQLLIQAIASAYPEVQSEYQKMSKPHSPFEKMFEAIAAAELSAHESG
jgi:hypothetical protein